MVTCCVGWHEVAARSKGGMVPLSCTLGCENVQTAVSGTGLQLIVSCFGKYTAVGRRTGNGKEQKMMMAAERASVHSNTHGRAAKDVYKCISVL